MADTLVQNGEIRRRRFRIACVVYLAIVVLLWLIPAVIFEHLGFKDKGSAPHIMLWIPAKISAAIDGNSVSSPNFGILAVISVAFFGLLCLPLLSAYLCRSLPVLRVALLIVGSLLMLAYFSIGIFGYLFWSRFYLG